MRLWYQSFSKFKAFGNYQEALKSIVEPTADPGTSVEIFDLREGGGIADQYRYLEYLDVGEVLRNGMKAQQNGYDAFLVGNIADPGIRELRELLTIPVLGLCETTLSIACMMASSFALITVNDKFTPRVLENVHRYGFTGRMASLEAMSIDHLPNLAPGFSDSVEDAAARDAILRSFAEAARKGIARGAEVLVPAGGVVMAMLAHAGIHKIDDVPILNGTVALTKMAEVAVKLQRLTGTFTSKRMTYAPPRGEMLKEIRAVYGKDIYPGADHGD
jgi:allantoin racemase